MPIPATTPKLVPEVPAKPSRTFKHLWVSSIHIDMPSMSQGSADLHSHYFDPESGEHLADGEPIVIENLIKAIQEVPEVKQAMDALLVAIPALRDWKANLEKGDA